MLCLLSSVVIPNDAWDFLTPYTPHKYVVHIDM